ncbi:MAG: hemolysin family protein [Candidatus Gastranaerophilales bacterium]|nr:hemolysin family protein [Candidatus Gastranaerophilales bacterium]
MDTDQSLLFNSLLIIFLLFANGFFVASEFALVSVRRTRLSQLAKEGNEDADIAINSVDHMDRSIAATQLGITIASIGLGWVGEATLVRFIEPMFHFLPEAARGVATHSLAVSIAFALITLMHVIIGELMPKSIALQFTEKTALVVARPMYFVSKIFAPFIFILNGIGNFLLSLLKIPPAHAGHLVHSVEELDMIINESHKEGVLNDTEKEILTNVFKFSDIQAKQVMVPRPDMTCIPIDIELSELNKIIVDTQYTRYPVYSEDLDHIAGILHIKDLFPLVMSGAEIKLSEIIRKPMLVPETMTIDNLMLEFKKCKGQMAFVIDEFGCVSGLVTLEDILEEIFGEVQDEFDEEEADIRQIYENEYIANAMMRIDEFNEYFCLDDNNAEVEDEDIETIGGLVVKNLGHIAKEGDTVEVENFEFRVIEVDNARIVKLKIKKLEPVDSEDKTSLEN